MMTRAIGLILVAMTVGTMWVRGQQPAPPQPGGTGDAYLGVSVRPVSPETAAHIDLPEDVGVTVWHVAPGSPAATAGLEMYDVLTELGDQLLVSDRQLAVVVRQYRPGERVTIRGIRRGVPFVAEASLNERPAGAPGPGAFVPRHKMKLNAAQLQDAIANAFGQAGLAHGVPPADAQVRTVQTHTATMVHHDGEHMLQVTTANGERRLVAKDADGKVVFEGPIQTEEQRGKLPPEIREKVERLPAVQFQGAFGGAGMTPVVIDGVDVRVVTPGQVDAPVPAAPVPPEPPAVEPGPPPVR